MLGKEEVRPALVVAAASASPSTVPLAKDAAKPHPYPGVEPGERGCVAVLEIFKPASQRPVDIQDDCVEAMAVRAPGFGANRVSEFPQALRSRPTIAELEVVAEEVKAATLSGVDDAGLVRVERQAGGFRPPVDVFQCSSGVGLAAAEDHEVVGVPCHLESRFGQCVVERVEVDVRQERAEDCSLRAAPLGRPAHRRVHHVLPKELRNQPQDTSVGNLCLDASHQLLVRNRVEVRLQIGVHHPRVARFQQAVHAAERVLAAPSRAEAVAVLGKGPLEDRFKHVTQRPLHHTVSHGRDTERALLTAARLRNPHPSDRMGLIRINPELLRELLQVSVQPSLVHRNRLVVYSRGSTVGLHFRERRPKVPLRVHLVNQTEPYASFHSGFQSRQHAIRPDRCFCPSPTATNISILYSILHLVWSFLHGSVLHTSISLLPFAPHPLQALQHYYGSSDSCMTLCVIQVSLLHLSVPSMTIP